MLVPCKLMPLQGLCFPVTLGASTLALVPDTIFGLLQTCTQRRASGASASEPPSDPTFFPFPPSSDLREYLARCTHIPSILVLLTCFACCPLMS